MFGIRSGRGFTRWEEASNHGRLVLLVVFLVLLAMTPGSVFHPSGSGYVYAQSSSNDPAASGNRIEPLPPDSDEEPAAVVIASRGRVVVTRIPGRGGSPRTMSPAKPGLLLLAGDRIQTDQESWVELEFTDVARVRIDPLSRVEIPKSSSSSPADRGLIPNLRLQVGAVWASVVSTVQRLTHFSIETPAAIAGVRGTQFYVAVDPVGRTTVSVDEGVVAVSTKDEPDKETLVGAGESTEVESGNEPAQPVPNPPGQREKWNEKKEWRERQKEWKEDVKKSLEAKGPGRALGRGLGGGKAQRGPAIDQVAEELLRVKEKFAAKLKEAGDKLDHLWDELESFVSDNVDRRGPREDKPANGKMSRPGGGDQAKRNTAGPDRSKSPNDAGIADDQSLKGEPQLKQEPQLKEEPQPKQELKEPEEDTQPSTNEVRSRLPAVEEIDEEIHQVNEPSDLRRGEKPGPHKQETPGKAALPDDSVPGNALHKGIGRAEKGTTDSNESGAPASEESKEAQKSSSGQSLGGESNGEDSPGEESSDQESSGLPGTLEGVAGDLAGIEQLALHGTSDEAGL